MKIEINRLRDNGESTIGTMKINDEFVCFTLEDTFNYPKVYGKTRIPEGEYRITHRNNGSMTHRYADKFDFHQGMLWLRGVPNFEYVYFHIGNREDDTDGCILMGTTCSGAIGNQNISGSTLAYKKYYQVISKAIHNGENVTVIIRD